MVGECLLAALSLALLLRRTLLISATLAARVIHLAQTAQLLVSHLHHLHHRIVHSQRRIRIRINHTPHREEEISQVHPVGTARNLVEIQVALRAVLVLDSRVRHHKRPHPVLAAPRLHLGQELLHLLRLREPLLALVYRHEHVGVNHQEIQPVLAAQALAHPHDIRRRRQLALSREIHHVVAQIGNQRVQTRALQLGIQLVGAHVLHPFLQTGNPHTHLGHVGEMLRLVGQLEREEAHALVAVEDEVRHHAVQEIRLSRVRDARHHHQSAGGSEMEHAVGQRAHADAVAVVILSQHHALDVVGMLFGGIHILHAQLLGAENNLPHGFGAIAGIHLADVLASAGQFGKGSLVGVELKQTLHQSPARAVGVAAHHDFLRLSNPFGKCLVALSDIRLASASHADNVGESALHQGETILFALGDNESVDGFGIDSQRVDAVDAVRGAGLRGRFLPEILDVSAVGVLRHASHLHVHDASAHAVAVGDGRHLLVSLRVVALGIIHLVRHVSAAYARLHRRLHGNAHILEILLHHVSGGNDSLGDGGMRCCR